MNNQQFSKSTRLKTDQISRDQVNSIVLFSNSGDDALAFLRILGPANSSGMNVIRGTNDGLVETQRVLEGDVVVLQRDFPGDLEAYEKIISLAHEHSKPVVLDLDDLLFELPENHPDRISHYFTKSLLPMLQAMMYVDFVTVATPALRNYCLNLNKNVAVFPNYLNDQLWKIIKPATNKKNNNHISIGYMGGHSHKPDILMVTPVLLKLLNKYPKRIEFKFWGIEPPEELAPFSQVEWCPPKSFKYSDFAEYFQTQTADIMIAPLVDSPFNQSKSCIKYLEYSALGVPGVYSKITPYESVIDTGVDGLLASTASEWEELLSNLIEDHNFRRRIALNAQEKILEHWLLSQNSYKFKQLFEDIFNKYSSIERTSSPMYAVVKSLTRQVNDENLQKNQLLMESKATIERLRNDINQLADENSQKNQRFLENTNRINSMQKEIKELSDDNRQKNQIILETQNRIDALVDNISQLSDENRQKNHVLLESKKRIGTLQNDLHHLTDEEHQKNQLLLENIKKIEVLEDKINQLSEENRQKSQSLIENTNRIDVLLQNLDQLKEQNAHMTEHVNEREEEILTYATSFSWRITRPLRYISRKLRNITR